MSGDSSPTSGNGAAPAIASAVARYRSITTAPGVCVAAVDLQNADLERGHIQCAGVEDLLTTRQVTDETVFVLGSLTKVFTSLLTACAVVQRRVELTDKVIDLLDEYPGVTGSPDFDAIELIHLVTHTSGMPNLAPGTRDVSRQLFADETPPEALRGYWEEFAAGPVKAVPSCWEYSNTAFVTLGFAVSAMFNDGGTNDYNALLGGLVTGPLGMFHTAAHPSGSVATGYSFINGSNHPALGTAFDLRSTGADMLHFLRANLGAADSPLSADLSSAIALTHAPLGTYPACATKSSVTMGMGWQEPHIDRVTSTRMLYKNGATHGFSCVAELEPDQGIGVAVLTNQFPSDRADSRHNPSTLAAEIRSLLREPRS